MLPDEMLFPSKISTKIAHNYTAKNPIYSLLLSRIVRKQRMKFIPTPVPIKYDFAYSATANKSGRMQYHKMRPGISKVRVSRTEFIKAYNDSAILAVKPMQEKGQELVFQLEFYV